MRKAALFFVLTALFAQSPHYGVGRTPTVERIRQWDIGIAPDGAGLPPGSGTAAGAKELFTSRCAKCHGSEGQGRDSVPLVGGTGTLGGVAGL